MVALEGTVKSLAGSADPKVEALRIRKEAEMVQVRSQLRELKPTKVRLSLAIALRDKAVKAVQLCRTDASALEALLQTKLEELAEFELDAVAKSASVDSLTAAYAA